MIESLNDQTLEAELSYPDVSLAHTSGSFNKEKVCEHANVTLVTE